MQTTWTESFEALQSSPSPHANSVTLQAMQTYIGFLVRLLLIHGGSVLKCHMSDTCLALRLETLVGRKHLVVLGRMLISEIPNKS